MNFAHLALAALGGLVAYLAIGFAMFAALPGMKLEFQKYPAVYRQEESMNKLMPFNMLGILVSLVIMAVLYAKMYPLGGGIVPGVFLGVLLGLFSVCIYVVHNYAILNIGAKLAVYEGISYLLQWVAAGAVIGLIYKP